MLKFIPGEAGRKVSNGCFEVLYIFPVFFSERYLLILPKRDKNTGTWPADSVLPRIIENILPVFDESACLAHGIANAISETAADSTDPANNVSRMPQLCQRTSLRYIQRKRLRF